MGQIHRAGVAGLGKRWVFSALKVWPNAEFLAERVSYLRPLLISNTPLKNKISSMPSITSLTGVG